MMDAKDWCSFAEMFFYGTLGLIVIVVFEGLVNKERW